jgi:hypothetical protein
VVVELCRSRTALLYGGGNAPVQRQQGQLQQDQPPRQQTEEACAARTASNGEASTSGAAAATAGLNPLSLSGTSFLEAFGRALSQGGQSGLVLRLLLAGQARRAAGGRTGPK